VPQGRAAVPTPTGHPETPEAGAESIVDRGRSSAQVMAAR
jgi:hypothetical protein